ncbi:Low-density lipoprotein receptor domain class A [Aphelenchoides besseyi]|nr:Low-density lipoprotein receptor domain class A [Aphelenchoides besseyi]
MIAGALDVVLPLLLTFLPSNSLASKIPAAFHQYAAQSASYDVQNPYSYPVRNSNVAPCQLSSMIDNRTSLPLAQADSSVSLQIPPQNVPSASISYVPIQVANVDPALPTPSGQQSTVLRQQPTVPLVPTASLQNGPRPNGHMAAIAAANLQQPAPPINQQQLMARQQAAAAQFAAQQLASTPTVNGISQQYIPPNDAQLTGQLFRLQKNPPYPTYESDAQVEFQRQQQQMMLEAQQRALTDAQRKTQPLWQSNVPLYTQNLPAGTGSSTSATMSTKSDQTTASTPMTPIDTNALSQLNAQQLEEYASRLRSQIAQEKTKQIQPEPQLLSNYLPQQSRLPNEIRGRINGAPPSANSQAQLVAMPSAVLNSAPAVEKPAALPSAAVESNLNRSVQIPLQTVDSTFPQQSEFVAQQILPSGMSTVPSKLTHEINYCDKRQFDDEKLAAEHLKRADYFIYNTSCSGTFFQCAIGQTFVLKCPSVDGQAFDPAISSCNFKNSVRFCPEYDHVLHCTIRETCDPRGQFACCESQQCIDYSERCNGHRECIAGEDETNCPSCARNEFACVKSGTCIPADLRCNGKVDDCADGSNLDEIGCSKNETCWGKFACDSAESIIKTGHTTCIDISKRCDSVVDCPSEEDELNCQQSDDSDRYLSCENQKQSIRKEQWCDGKAQCLDGSDEKYCF